MPIQFADVFVATNEILARLSVVNCTFFNGLREISALSIQFADVVVAADEIFARLSFVKGRSSSHQVPVMCHRLAILSSPIDPFSKWVYIRGSH